MATSLRLKREYKTGRDSWRLHWGLLESQPQFSLIFVCVFIFLNFSIIVDVFFIYLFNIRLDSGYGNFYFFILHRKALYPGF